jgi:hypothetical protein
MHHSITPYLYKPSVSPEIPPVRVTLAAPQETGFLLGRVTVTSLHQVWAIFEVCLLVNFFGKRVAQ